VAPSPWDGGVVDAKIRYSPHVIIPNFVVLGQTVWAYVGVPKFGGGGDGVQPLGIGAWLTAKYAFPGLFYLSNFVILDQTVRAHGNYGVLPENFNPLTPRLSRSLKVDGTNTD